MFCFDNIVMLLYCTVHQYYMIPGWSFTPSATPPHHHASSRSQQTTWIPVKAKTQIARANVYKVIVLIQNKHNKERKEEMYVMNKLEKQDTLTCLNSPTLILLQISYEHT